MIDVQFVCNVWLALTNFVLKTPRTTITITEKLEVLRERRPPPNASIVDNPVNPDFGLRTPGSGR